MDLFTRDEPDDFKRLNRFQLRDIFIGLCDMDGCSTVLISPGKFFSIHVSFASGSRLVIDFVSSSKLDSS
jgi:hypothetical protein